MNITVTLLDNEAYLFGICTVIMPYPGSFVCVCVAAGIHFLFVSGVGERVSSSLAFLYLRHCNGGTKIMMTRSA